MKAYRILILILCLTLISCSKGGAEQNRTSSDRLPSVFSADKYSLEVSDGKCTLLLSVCHEGEKIKCIVEDGGELTGCTITLDNAATLTSAYSEVYLTVGASEGFKDIFDALRHTPSKDEYENGVLNFSFDGVTAEMTYKDGIPDTLILTGATERSIKVIKVG